MIGDIIVFFFANFISDVLVLGTYSEGGVVLITPDKAVKMVISSDNKGKVRCFFGKFLDISGESALNNSVVGTVYLAFIGFIWTQVVSI